MIVAPKANSGEAGAISTDYKQTKLAITNGKDGKGFAETFTDGEDGAKRCCEKFQESAARVELYVEAVSLGFNKSEAYNVLDDVMPAEEAMELALDILGQDEDLSQLESKDAATLVRELADYEINEESMEDDADETDKENCITIFQSQACDIKCKLFVAYRCLQKGIAFTEERIDREFGTDYTALIIPVSIRVVCSIFYIWYHIHHISPHVFRFLNVILNSCAKAHLWSTVVIHWITRTPITQEVTLQLISLVQK